MSPTTARYVGPEAPRSPIVKPCACSRGTFSDLDINAPGMLEVARVECVAATEHDVLCLQTVHTDADLLSLHRPVEVALDAS